jgi:uncharacterized protein (TIGR02466 family)
MIQIKELFPTPIGYFNNIEFTNKVLPIANSILEQINNPHPLSYLTTFNNSEIQTYLKSFTWIEDYIKKISYEYSKEIGFYLNDNIEIGTLFVSRINNTQHHERHVHPNSILSGVMYLNTTPNCAPIIFEDPRSVRDFNHMRRTKEWKNTSAGQMIYTPTSGDIILFEAWMPHRVPSIEEQGNRTTLVFNIGYDTF